MPTWRCNPSALNIPDVGIVVVGGCADYIGPPQNSDKAELLVHDSAYESGWRWIELKPMLQARRSPEIAYFKGCVVVVGGDEGLTVECLPLSSVEQTESQWTQLHGFFKQHISSISLVTLNDRLIFLLSSFNWADVYEFLPTGNDQSLANFEWKQLFRLDGLESPKLFVAEEDLDEG
ncbi:unnamed protein product [Taenia asiatica]|uniref:F-box only protein 21 n=1 Tax=Taenia asiatica TaxID=60517 RepID=A0A0R3VZ51_TAEAS|nr:unnamed protein product [Taenia asiatica]